MFVPWHVIRSQRAAAAASSTPVATITTTKAGTYRLALMGTSGVDVRVDPGDGGAEEIISLIGLSWAIWDHVFTGGTHTVRVLNNFDHVVRISSETDPQLIDVDTRVFKNLTHQYLTNSSNFTSITKLADASSWQYLHSNGITDISPLVNTSSFNVYLNGNPIVYSGYTWTTKSGGIYHFDSTVSTQAEVDQWIIDLNDALWSGCAIYLDGTNPAPTAASAVALAGLAGRGCTVYTN